MKTPLPIALLLAASFFYAANGQNVFNPADPIVRHDPTKPLGSAENPDQNKSGLQKWVSRPTNGVSTGSSSWDASSYKAYYINTGGRKVAFRLKFPKSFSDPASAGKKYPVMIFFHGAGENGCPDNGGVYNNEKHLLIGGALFRDRVDNGSFDGFLLYPQKQQPTDCWGNWSLSTTEFNPIFRIVDSLAKYARLDIDRVLVTGLSAGGMASFYVASNYATRVAKIAPSAAASGASNNTTFMHIPIWFATGAKDASPSPSTATKYYDKYKKLGMDIRHTLFQDQGHSVWNSHWRQTGFVEYMNDLHKANPMVYFQRNEFCKDSPIAAKMGITAGFYAYEWQRDGIVIATRTNGTNTVVNGASISSFTGNEIVVKLHGTYRVRFKRSASAEWSAWSPKPVVVGEKKVTQTPAITIVGARSKVVPALDGSTKTPLQLPEGYVKYEWYDASNAIVATTRTFTAGPGQYRAKVYEEYGCGSNFSSIYTVVNAEGSPKPAAASNLTATSTSPTSIQLRWTDNSNNENGFEIYRGTTPKGPYQFLILSKTNSTSYLDRSVSATQMYYYIVRAVNNTGAAAASNEAFAGNNPPAIGDLPTLYVDSDASATLNFTVSDPDEPVTVAITSRINFLTLTKTSATGYRITASPKADHVGWYDVSISAKDGKGATSTKTFTMVVSEKNVRSAYINFGNTAHRAPLPWNNWLGKRSANNVITNIKDVKNASTTFNITMLETWSTTTDLGHITGNNSGVFPDTVLRSGIADTSSIRTIRVGGLNTARRYNLVFVGSQNEGDNSVTEYSSGSQKALLVNRYNTRSSANLNHLTPNSSGQITVTVKRVNPGTLNYLNAMVIEEHAPSSNVSNPGKLIAEPIDRTSVQLTWTDRSWNENSTDGFQLQYATDSVFTQNVKTVSISGNTTAHKLSGLSAHKRYWFRIRAKAGSTYSEYSNIAVAVTPEFMVYVNFNYSVPNGPTPWNNLQASPAAEQTITGLRNQSGTSSGMNLTIERPFNGEFNAGMSTSNNSGVVPDRVLQSNFWLDKTQISQIKLSKLNKSRRYRIGFFGSSGPLGWFKGNYTATYSIGNRTVYLNSWMNTTGIVWIGDILPDAGANIIIRFSTTSNAMYGFNGGMIIQAYSDSPGGTMPNEAETTEEALAYDVPVTPDSTFTEPVIYPNPFSDHFNIQLHNPVHNSSVQADMFDMNGRLLLRRTFNNVPAGNVILRMDQLRLNSSERAVMVSISANGRKFKTIRLLHHQR